MVHSFTGPLDEAKQILDLDLMIGINGCSLKSEENLSVVKEIPLDKILIETDSPYCEIRNTHASIKYVKTKYIFDNYFYLSLPKCFKALRRKNIPIKLTKL